MKTWWLNGLSMFVAGTLAVFALGCGDDDKGSNSSSDLTEEEQYALAAQVMQAAPGLMLQNFGSGGFHLQFLWPRENGAIAHRQAAS